MLSIVSVESFGSVISCCTLRVGSHVMFSPFRPIRFHHVGGHVEVITYVVYYIYYVIESDIVMH